MYGHNEMQSRSEIKRNYIIILQEWKDDRLIWNPSEKGDIKNIFADPTTIWHPELIVDNS